jgi:hypothetical protein
MLTAEFQTITLCGKWHLVVQQIYAGNSVLAAPSIVRVHTRNFLKNVPMSYKLGGMYKTHGLRFKTEINFLKTKTILHNA